MSKKLNIIYKTEEGLHHEETEMRVSFIKDTTKLYIGTKETKKLAELVDWVTKELRKSNFIGQDETLQVDDYAQFIMGFETDNNTRMENKVYPYSKYIWENRDNEEKLNTIQKFLAQY